MNQRIVHVKTNTLPREEYNPRNVYGSLKALPYRCVKYDWDDPHPDIITWEHFLEKELAIALRSQKIPWHKVIRCQRKFCPGVQEIKMAISLSDRFLVGVLSWK